MLLKCPFHITERNCLFKKLQPFLQDNLPEHDGGKFSHIMQLKTPKAIEALGSFLHTGFSRRHDMQQEIKT